MYPKFFSKNFVDENDAIVVTSGDDVKKFLYDRDNSTQWKSLGETDEDGDYSCQIEVDFRSDNFSPVVCNRTFDTLVLLNINLKQFKLQYWTGSSWADISQTIKTTNSNSNVVIEFIDDPVTSSKIKLLMDKTIVANQEKKIGEFKVLEHKVTLINTLAGTYNRGEIKIGGRDRLKDGDLSQWFTARKATFTNTYANISHTIRTALKQVKLEGDLDFLTFYPDGDKWIDEIYEGIWVNTWNERYDPKTTFYSITVEFEER